MFWFHHDIIHVVADIAPWAVYVGHGSSPFKWPSSVLHPNRSFHGDHHTLCQPKMVTLQNSMYIFAFKVQKSIIRKICICKCRYLDVAGKKNSTLYVLNGVAMFAGWLVSLSCPRKLGLVDKKIETSVNGINLFNLCRLQESSCSSTFSTTCLHTLIR